MQRIKQLFNRRARLVRNLAIASAITIFAVGTAMATLKMRLSDGTTTVDIVDNGVGDLSPGITGLITASVSFPNYLVDVQVGSTKPVLGNSLQPEMDLGSTVIPSGTAIPSLTIDVSDTGYLGAGTVFLKASNTQTALGSVTFKAWADPANVDFGTGGIAGSIGPVGSGTFLSTAGVISTVPFSLHERVIFSPTGAGGVFSTDFDTKVSPEGSSLAMLLPGLAPLGLILRRRMKKA